MSWVSAGDVRTITRARKTVIEVDGYEVLVLSHDGNLYAFQNRCIHKRRELAKGVVLNGRLVCPGHQWAFALESGWESIKEECQPMFPVRVVDGKVEVDVTVPEPAPASADVDGVSVVAVDVGGSKGPDLATPANPPAARRPPESPCAAVSDSRPSAGREDCLASLPTEIN